MYIKEFFWPRFGGWVALSWIVAFTLWWFGYAGSIVRIVGYGSIAGGIAGAIHGMGSSIRNKQLRYYRMQVGTCAALIELRRKAPNGEILPPAVKALNPEFQKYPPVPRLKPLKSQLPAAVPLHTKSS